MPFMKPRRIALYVLLTVWIVMAIISLGMVITGKAQLYPDIATVALLLMALTVFVVFVLTLPWAINQLTGFAALMFERIANM